MYSAIAMCGDPGSIFYLFGRRFVEGTTEGSTVTYSCIQGLVVKGDTVRTCMADGQWSGSLPVCTGEGRVQHLAKCMSCMCVFKTITQFETHRKAQHNKNHNLSTKTSYLEWDEICCVLNRRSHLARPNYQSIT